MGTKNRMYVKFDAKSVNEGFARMVVAAFVMDMNPTLDDLSDIKTAVSEAVTNAIIHGYQDEEKQVEMEGMKEGNKLTIVVRDYGIGIADVKTAMKPFFTTKQNEERSGMGFAFMEAFMDELQVISEPGKGTEVTMTKHIERSHE